MPESHRLLLYGPRTCGLQSRFAEVLKRVPGGLAHVQWIGEPVVSGPLQPIISLRREGLVFLSANVVNGLTEELRDVELVEADFPIGVRYPAAHRIDIGKVHVHRDRLDLRSGAIGQCVEEAVEALAGSSVGNVDDRASLLIGHDGDVFVSTLKGGLIDADMPGTGVLSAFQSAAHGLLLNTVNGVPADVKLSGNIVDGGAPEPIDGHGFEESSKPAAGLGPGNVDLVHAVLRAFGARNGSFDDGAILHCVKVAPATRSMVMTRTRRLTQWTRDSRSTMIADADLHRPALDIQFDLRDSPWLGYAEQAGKQFGISHPGIYASPTRSGEAPIIVRLTYFPKLLVTLLVVITAAHAEPHWTLLSSASGSFWGMARGADGYLVYGLQDSGKRSSIWRTVDGSEITRVWSDSLYVNMYREMVKGIAMNRFGEGIAIRAFGQALSTVDDGQNWSVDSLPENSTHLRQVIPFGPHGFILSADMGSGTSFSPRLWYLRNNDSPWENLSLPTGMQTRSLLNICAPDTTRLFALFEVGSFREELYASTDRGANWSRVSVVFSDDLPDPREVVAITFESPDVGWLGVEHWTQIGVAAAGEVYSTSDGGVTWNRTYRADAALGPGAIDYVVVGTGGVVTAVGYNGTVLRLQSGIWVDESVPGADPHLEVIPASGGAADLFAGTDGGMWRLQGESSVGAENADRSTPGGVPRALYRSGGIEIIGASASASASAGSLRATIVDASGRNLDVGEITSEEGGGRVWIPCPDLIPGMYFVRIGSRTSPPILLPVVVAR